MNFKLSIISTIIFATGIMLTGCNTQDNSQTISKDKVQNTKEAFAKVTLRMNSAIENFKAE